MKTRSRTGIGKLKARYHIAINEADEVLLAKIFTILSAARELLQKNSAERDRRRLRGSAR